MILSIIIPTYNAERYIERAIRSVSSFKGFYYEILCVNDGSTDNSLQVILNLQKELSNLKVISQINMGLSGARNTGIKNAKGKYIIFLDADDWLTIDRNELKEILRFIENHQIQVYGYNLEYFDEFEYSIGRRKEHPIPYFEINTGAHFLEKGYQPSSSCLFIYERENLRLQDLWFYPKISQQDVEFTVRLMVASEIVYFSKNIFYAYYRHSGTITIPKSIEGKKKYLRDSVIVSNLIKQNLDKNVNANAIKNAIVKNYNSVVWNLLWRFYKYPTEVDQVFKLKCLQELKEKQLYPIKGPLKTPFQNLSRYFFNQEFLMKWILKK